MGHRDSGGNSGVIRPGDVQWMTAASGVVHEELHEEEFTKNGGIFELVQLWLNLPKAQKMSEPRYQAITKAQIPVIELEGGGHARVIAGELLGRLGPARTFTPVNLFDVILKAGERFELPLPDGHNAAVVLRKGDVLLNGMDHLSGEALIAPLTEEGDSVTLEAKADTQLLILSGEPILEPVESYGPFVMNTREEIQRAVEDYRAGRMGRLS